MGLSRNKKRDGHLLEQFLQESLVLPQLSNKQKVTLCQPCVNISDKTVCESCKTLQIVNTSVCAELSAQKEEITTLKADIDTCKLNNQRLTCKVISYNPKRVNQMQKRKCKQLVDVKSKNKALQCRLNKLLVFIHFLYIYIIYIYRYYLYKKYM